VMTDKATRRMNIFFLIKNIFVITSKCEKCEKCEKCGNMKIESN
jgi:hypothetical protein